jgi:hypothetical protein
VRCEHRRIWKLGTVLLALIVPGVPVILMVCLLGIGSLSKKWDGDVFGQFLLLRAEITHPTRETGGSPGTDINWRKSKLNMRNAALQTN